MKPFGIFKGEQLLIVCGSQEKAEDLVKRYEGAHTAEIEYIHHKWVKKL